METFSMDLNGRKLVMETGKLAKQASGAVLVRYGETLLLVTATGSDTPREDANFLPLTVDYEERHYAVGRMPGGFIKREGRPSEKATLAARLTDRPLRPLFPKKFYNSIHVVATVLSVDQDSSPETLAIIGASAALSISKIPFNGPIGAVMVGLKDGEPVVNPRKEELDNNPLRLVVAGTKDAIMMVESSADEISDEKIVECIERGHEEIKRIVALQEEMVEKVGIPKMEIKDTEEFPEDVLSEMESVLKEKLDIAMRVNEKKAREDNLKAVKDEFVEKYLEIYPESKSLISSVYEANLKATMRKMILQENLRPDGRKTDEIRPISCEVGLLPRTHGSALFTRGQTQVLNICTLAGLREVQVIDGLGIEESKRYIHHYNFPAYSVGETGFMRGPGRREIGHGVLAENALKAIIPDIDDFPYTVRLVSEVLESNGSTSMGSVCASSLSLMDAGVTVKKHVSGIAMGLIKEGDSYAILSDIQGMEDFLGDMDFKVAGTRDGITALQMDIKITGISREIMIEAIAQAKKGYFYIMDKMEEVISSPNEEMSPYAPRIITTQVAMDKIRDIIGPGGRIINKIIEDYGVGIDIEPDGKVFIAAVDPEAGKKALETIQNLVREVTAGETFVGKVTRVEKYGAFVEILPGKEGLVHISQLDFKRVEKTEDIVNLGDEVLVKVIGVDDRGRIDLSRKDAMEPPPGYKPPSRNNNRPPRSGGERSRGDRDRNKRF